ncbi:MAG: hypothetical protein PWP23_1984 [Candidatus Sumerlaeota bacterium]|nr:hypothetical protein [Candidatus Sumerlaeota bacterium]
MPMTLPIWITDSSMIEWNDTVKLDVCFPRWRWPQVVAESLGADIDEHYEGIVDPAIAVGGLHLTWREGGLDGEAEWVVLFDRPLAAFDAIGPNTPCVLQGMIEGKWIAPLAAKGEVAWVPATVGNNLVARGRGIATTLGGIQQGDDGVGRSVVMVNFPMAAGGNRVHHAYGGDLMKLPIVEIVESVWRWARENGNVEIRGVNFGANGEMSAYAVDQDRQGQHLRHAFLPKFFSKLRELCPQETLQVVNDVRAAMFQEVLDKGEYARPDATMLLTVTDGKGWLAGEGAILLADPAMTTEE